MSTFIKIAVNLGQLRKATKPLMHKVIRRSVDIDKTDDLGSIVLGSKRSRRAQGPASLLSTTVKEMGQFLPAGAPQIEQAKRLTGKVFAGGPTNLKVGRLGKAYGADVGVQHLRSPEAKEMYNRTVLLHEGREGATPARDVTRFGGHASVHPPLQDLNIAATLTGKGSGEASKAIRTMRAGEIAELKKIMPTSAGRLNLGEERLSRHAIKRLNEAYPRAERRYSTEQVRLRSLNS